MALLGKRADDTRVYLPASAVVPPDERVPDGKQSVRNDRERRSEQLLLFEFESAVHMGEKSGILLEYAQKAKHPLLAQGVLAERAVCLVQKKAVERIAESFGRSG